MKLFGRVGLVLEDRLAVDAALDDAFGPLRARTASIGAARVRAAVRWTRPEPLRGIALVTRIGELSMAAVVSAFLFGASIASVAPAPDVSRDAVTAGEWTLNGRTARQRPIVSRAADYRIAGDDLVNAAVVRREARRPDPVPERTSSYQ